MAGGGIFVGRNTLHNEYATPAATIDLSGNFAPGKVYSTGSPLVEATRYPASLSDFTSTDRLFCVVMGDVSVKPSYTITPTGWNQLFQLYPGGRREMTWFEFTGTMPADPVASWSTIGPKITPNPAPSNSPTFYRYNALCFAVRGAFTNSIVTGTNATSGTWATTPNVTTSSPSLAFGWIFGGQSSSGVLEGTDFSPAATTQNGWSWVRGIDDSSWLIYSFSLVVNEGAMPPAAVTWESSAVHCWATFAVAASTGEWGVDQVRW